MAFYLNFLSNEIFALSISDHLLSIYNAADGKISKTQIFRFQIVFLFTIATNTVTKVIDVVCG